MALKVCDPGPTLHGDPFGAIRVPEENVGPSNGPVRPMVQADVDRVQSTARHRMNGDRLAIDAGGASTLAAPVVAATKSLVCPDLNAARDAKRPWWNRLAHAALLGGGFIGGPDTAALKALGMHVAETTATHTVFRVAAEHGGAGAASAGRLIIPSGTQAMSATERSAATYLAKRGHEVVRILESTTAKTADFLVDGKPTELKTISNITGRDFGKSVIKRIREGFAQAPNVLLDARTQPSMNFEAAKRIFGRIGESAPEGSRTVRIIGKDFDVKADVK